jgi:hypothetical protein
METDVWKHLALSAFVVHYTQPVKEAFCPAIPYLLLGKKLGPEFAKVTVGDPVLFIVVDILVTKAFINIGNQFRPHLEEIWYRELCRQSGKRKVRSKYTISRILRSRGTFSIENQHVVIIIVLTLSSFPHSVFHSGAIMNMKRPII